MTVKSIIGECLLKLGEENFIENATFTVSERKLADRLLAALNIVYAEAVTEYVPLIYSEEVEFKNGELFVSALTKPVLYPIKAEKNGVTYKIKTFPTYLKCAAEGFVKLTYAYLPEALTLSGELKDARITRGILSDGTLGEYYFENKVFDLAKSYDTDFRNALSKLRYKGREIKIRAGRWNA